MSTSVCFYFQVHQPYRLRSNYSFFDIGNSDNFEDESANAEIMKKVAKNCYLPTNKLLLSLIKKNKGKFKVSFSISGMALEQFEQYTPEVIESFKKLVDTGYVELICETYYHSLSFVKSKTEFLEQVHSHKCKIKEIFDYDVTTFRNTELVYNNELAQSVEKLGFKTILAEGTDHVLKWRNANFLYTPTGCSKLKLLMKNYKLSDDIAFRFSNKNWSGYPLTAKKYANWLHNISLTGEVINLFMDYETFGEHHNVETGIFDFLSELPSAVLKRDDFSFVTPSEASDKYESVGPIDVSDFTAWADESRDLSAWMGNDMQNSAMDMLYEMGDMVKETGDPELLHKWRKLQTSDHYYYISTKWDNDGAVHNYFSPFNSPHDAFMTFSNVVHNMKLNVENRINS